MSGRRTGLIAENRRARFDYSVLETIEAGLVLEGTEVKALRRGQANIAHAFVRVEGGEAFLINADIPVYEAGNRYNHKPMRARKLLLKKREIERLAASVQREGMTLVPLKIYFTPRGFVKLLIGSVRGRKKTDKREHEKRRDWQRDKARLLRSRG